ncbi:MAG: isoaspartyl peptidase/L-asparaginase [Actinomycetota bacterium]|nr:isoaspartyl peptidase/L-asparaginase [Actinomycetota bacterium]
MTVVFVHGGVSGTPSDGSTDLSGAVRAGGAAPTALDAVERAVQALEDEPGLNAGFGSVLHRDGGIELDAGIADGFSSRGAGVANVDLTHPISLARIVLEQTPHVIVTGDGAQLLGDEHRLDRLVRSTDEQHQRWERANNEGALDLESYARPEHVDTVGAVALDSQGRLAAGSSTGGVFGKLRGRVGDAPVFGAGFYADQAVAVVGTGVGEAFLLTLACRQVADLVERGADVEDACAEVIGRIQKRAPGAGSEGSAAIVPAGLLALGRDGDHGAVFSGASWQVEGPEGPVEVRRLD